MIFFLSWQSLLPGGMDRGGRRRRRSLRLYYPIRLSLCISLCSVVGVCLCSYRELQVNLIRSHAAGVGSPLSAEKTRMLLALRVNVLAKGCSGISLETLHQYIDAFNGVCVCVCVCVVLDSVLCSV